MGQQDAEAHGVFPPFNSVCPGENRSLNGKNRVFVGHFTDVLGPN